MLLLSSFCWYGTLNAGLAAWWQIYDFLNYFLIIFVLPLYSISCHSPAHIRTKSDVVEIQFGKEFFFFLEKKNISDLVYDCNSCLRCLLCTFCGCIWKSPKKKFFYDIAQFFYDCGVCTKVIIWLCLSHRQIDYFYFFALTHSIFHSTFAPLNHKRSNKCNRYWCCR